MARIGAVILAAGASSRLGEPKQLLVWRGKTLVVRAVEAVLAAGVAASADDVVVVVGAHADGVRAALAGMPVRVHVVENAAWREGMGASIRAGVSALAKGGVDAKDAVMIALCDQPHFSEQAAARLIAEWKRCGGIAAARYAGRVGAPAIFGREYFGALSALKGDEGARRILAENAERVASIDLPELARDVDTPEEWEKARNS